MTFSPHEVQHRGHLGLEQANALLPLSLGNVTIYVTVS